MVIQYKVNEQVTVDQFIDLLNTSTLGERRPVDNLECIKGMIENANLTITAWDKEKLVGIARSVTDFHFACYLSDLAVSTQYQHQGIGIELQRLTQKELGPECQLILLAAPAAKNYYAKIGYTHNERCWMVEKNDKIGS